MHDDTIIRFELGELSADEARQVGARLAAEPALAARHGEARALLASLRDAAAERPSNACLRAVRRIARPNLFDRLTDALGRAADTIHAAIAYDTRLQPALAGMRGAADAAHIAYEADGIDAHLRLAHTDGPMRRVTGQVLPLSGAPARGMAAVASLSDREAPIQLIPLDDAGLFTIDLPVGRYALAARCGGRDLDLGDLEIM